MRTPEFIAQGQSKTSPINKYHHLGDGASGFRIDPHKVTSQNGLSHSSSMIHPSAVGSWNKAGSTRNIGELRTQNSLNPQAANTSYKKDDRALNKDRALVKNQLFLPTFPYSNYYCYYHHHFLIRSSESSIHTLNEKRNPIHEFLGYNKTNENY